MSRKFTTQRLNGEAATDWHSIHVEAAKHEQGIIEVRALTSDDLELSDGQRKWWKGILIPSLATSTGHTERWWENELKLKVMPEEFQPTSKIIDGHEHWYLPSITKLSMERMNVLIVSTVKYLNDRGFDWVELPDELKRSM